MRDPRAALARLEEKLSGLGLPLTEQRRRIYGALVGRDDHPTAEDLLSQVRRTLPRISFATVYRTLERLASIGAVRKVAHRGSAARYDAKLGRHHHLVCDRCGRISDVEAPELDGIALPRLAGRAFEVHDYALELRGLCTSCCRNRRGSNMRETGGSR
jgi:Fur family peroxide stress response transcriptional regulator